MKTPATVTLARLEWDLAIDKLQRYCDTWDDSAGIVHQALSILKEGEALITEAAE
jgi:hypothetical protein